MQRTDGVWVGWSGTAGTAPDPWDTAGMHLVGVSLSADEVEGFYEGFCNATLWPLYHDVIAPPVFEDRWWNAYVRVNDRFAALVDECCGAARHRVGARLPAAVGAGPAAAATPGPTDRVL